MGYAICSDTGHFQYSVEVEVTVPFDRAMKLGFQKALEDELMRVGTGEVLPEPLAESFQNDPNHRIEYSSIQVGYVTFENSDHVQTVLDKFLLTLIWG